MKSQKQISTRSKLGLDWLNFFLADVQTGVGPFLAIYLAGYHWNQQQVGLVLALGSIAGIITQTPSGALVDYLKAKRAIISIGVIVLATCSLLIAFYPSFWPVISAQVLIGGTSSVFNPAICAISLGIVGHKLFDTRQGRNQMFNSAGNVIAAISMGIIGYYISNRDIFFFVAILSIPTMLSILLINPGRKPLLLIAFGVLPIRGILYTLTNNTELLVAIQVLDGVGAGIFGVVSVLVIADLTEGTGRFNLTLGAISTAVGIGASLSQVIAGSIVKSFGYSTGFVFLATIALAAFIILYCFMPETKTKTI